MVDILPNDRKRQVHVSLRATKVRLNAAPVIVTYLTLAAILFIKVLVGRGMVQCE